MNFKLDAVAGASVPSSEIQYSHASCPFEPQRLYPNLVVVAMLKTPI